MKKAGIILLLLIGIGAGVHRPDSQTVFDAAKKGDIAALKGILEANPRLVDARGEGGRSPLQEALMAGQSETARFLIQAGADVNWRDAEGIAPLGYAALAGDVAAAGLLIEGGARADAQDTALGGTPLDSALRGRANVIRLLVDKGAPLDIRTKDGRTALAVAIEGGKRDCAEILLSRGASADARDEKNRTLLHRVVLARDAEIDRLLLARGADPLVRSAHGNTALDLALQEDLTEIAGLLSASGKAPVFEFPSIAGPYLGQPPPGPSPRMFAPGIVSTERNELNAVFTPDGKEFYFTIHGASGGWTIMRTALENGRWSRPIFFSRPPVRAGPGRSSSDWDPAPVLPGAGRTARCSRPTAATCFSPETATSTGSMPS